MVDGDEKVKTFFKQGRPLIYKKNEIILRGDEVPSGIFYLNKGYVKNYAFSENGDEFTFILYRKGDFFPISWTFNQTRKPYFIETLTQCVIYKRDRKEFLDFLTKNPDVLLYLTGKITRRFDGLLVRMEHMAFGNAYKKVCSILYILAERFGKEKNRNGVLIDMPVTHREIANLLGVARETVSVEISKLKKAKVIKNAGKHIHVLNLEKLKNDSLIT